MRIVFFILVSVILLVVAVQGGVEFSCTTDSDCVLIAGGGSCMSGTCESSDSFAAETAEVAPVDEYFRKGAGSSWDFVLLQDTDSVAGALECVGDGCLRLAPGVRQNYFIAIYQWLVYA